MSGLRPGSTTLATPRAAHNQPSAGPDQPSGTSSGQDQPAKVSVPGERDEFIPRAESVDSRRGNVFFEQRSFSDSELTQQSLRLSPSERNAVKAEFTCGRTGMILAAAFMSPARRDEGDFSRAYGDPAWRGYMRAYAYLSLIPQGQLLLRLDDDLLRQVNEFIRTADRGLKARVKGKIQTLMMGRTPRGGRLRQGAGFAAESGPYTDEQVRNIRCVGVEFLETPGSRTNARWGLLRYPDPSLIESRLADIIARLKADLGSPDSDVIGAAAAFQRHMVALHPFEDGNGRTSRLLMNRILDEFDLPPAILQQPSEDLTFSPDAWRQEVARGMRRTKLFVASYNGRPCPTTSLDGYLSTYWISVFDKRPLETVIVDQSPFALGLDGFLYSPNGRPFLVIGEEVTPLSQIEYYVLARRLISRPIWQANATLKKITCDTCDLYHRVRRNPRAGDYTPVLSDRAARQADAMYRLHPYRSIARLLAELAHVDGIDEEELFGVGASRGTPISSLLSKYTQVDLELWHLGTGIARAGHKAEADQITAERDRLFDLAKERLRVLTQPEGISPGNTLGFSFRYEQLMYEGSPLRFDSLTQAIEAEGDEMITAWRGDYAIARWLGMAPNNDVREKDAMQVARERAARGTIGRYHHELRALQTNAVGRQYICLTSDLALLVRSFASSDKSASVNLTKLPPRARELLFTIVDSAARLQTPADANAGTEVQGGSETAERPSKGPPQFRLQDCLGVPGSVLGLRTLRTQDRLEVTAHRKAFCLRLPKKALLPGTVTLRNESFCFEQELHGLEKVRPWQVKAVYTNLDLGSELKSPPGHKAATCGPSQEPAQRASHAHADRPDTAHESVQANQRNHAHRHFLDRKRDGSRRGPGRLNRGS